MSCGELSLESPPPFLYVTWKIPVFFQLSKESRYFLESPEFAFADGRYCLRLTPDSTSDGLNCVRIKLHNLTDTVPGRNVSYEVGLKSRAGIEFDILYGDTQFGREFCISLSALEDVRHSHFPDGSLTVFCSVRKREPSSAGSPESGGAETQVFPNVELSSSERNIRNSRMSDELFIESPPFLRVTWKIPRFFERAMQSRDSLESPEFPFADGRYSLRFNYGENCVIRLVNLTDTVPGTDVSYEVVLKSRTGKEIDLQRVVRVPDSSLRFLSFGQFIYHGKISFCCTQGNFKFKMDSFVSDGTLTVFCFVRLREGPKSGGAETSNGDEEQRGLKGVAKLLSDYRQLLKKGAESDACLVVSGKEFRAHQNILSARSPIFEAMFGHETAEKKSGRVVIDDLDPESFGDFLEYLYTGGVEAGISDDNAFGLYAAADKYDVPTLKSECLAHMCRNMSVDSFSNVITLALRHHEEKLLQRAVIFFKENISRIIVTVKWQQFVIENGTSANELLIKAFVPGGQ